MLPSVDSFMCSNHPAGGGELLTVLARRGAADKHRNAELRCPLPLPPHCMMDALARLEENKLLSDLRLTLQLLRSSVSAIQKKAKRATGVIFGRHF